MREVDNVLFGIDAIPGIEVPGEKFVLDKDCRFGGAEALFWKSARWSPRLSSAMRAFNPDLVIAHHLQHAWRISRLTESNGFPLAVMCHGSDLLEMRGPQRSKSRAMRQLTDNWARFVETVRLFLPVSQFLSRHLAEAGAPPSRIAVHHLGVPIPDASGLGSAADCSGILFVGRLVENKGCALLLRAAGEIARQHPVTVTVVGDGPERGALLRQAAGLPAGADVRLLGSQSYEAVSRLMRKHRVVCIPSVDVASGPSEGLGLVACEAAAHGRPVVVFETGGLPETVVRHRTGLVVPQGDVSALARAISSLLADDGKAAAMGDAARLHALENFDAVKQGIRLHELLADRGLLSFPECEAKV
ncbi:glycosyltransferase [Streptomyces sp. GC420]|uniref:glycosyltransferase n=1 Tax=Streptomyces sp. GC420 TaxID=2697568 RepID=UPI001FB7AA88|nr:glycosyltransferase [Streptomyces sp. GC420]